MFLGRPVKFHDVKGLYEEREKKHVYRGLHQTGLVGVYYPAPLFYMSSRYYMEALCLQSEHSIDSLCDFSRVVMKCSDETA